MASVSATCCKLGSSLKLPRGSSQSSGKLSSLKMVSVSRFPSLQSSRFFICCSAKPETVDKVCEIVRNQLALPPESPLTPDSKFAALGADSLDTVEIVMALEDAFNISVEEESSQNITSVQEAADMIEKLVEKKTEAA
ncbi:acyl carrier protein 1, chloroplastic-like [Aristolochia californica]|uniref:acyl carrier protein 1, chloroplastic-like n=1 Tax=Aristolochia californica TaxID=171875 RepID=UPI0035DA89D6